MLLQPFVENAFKHGTSKDIQHPRIQVNINILNNSELEFMVKNSKSPENQHDRDGYTEGIGLKNVKKRLEILYPGHHRLDIAEEPDQFNVHLRIELNQPKT
jgi:LytS/YehU family sensor histidine kinase